MQVQEDISADKLAAKIDTVIEVLVDAVDDEGTIARSKADAPEIDGLVYIDGYFDAEPGDFLQVKVIDADHHDLYAEPAGARLIGMGNAAPRPRPRLQLGARLGAYRRAKCAAAGRHHAGYRLWHVNGCLRRGCLSFRLARFPRRLGAA